MCFEVNPFFCMYARVESSFSVRSARFSARATTARRVPRRPLAAPPVHRRDTAIVNLPLPEFTGNAPGNPKIPFTGERVYRFDRQAEMIV